MKLVKLALALVALAYGSLANAAIETSNASSDVVLVAWDSQATTPSKPTFVQDLNINAQTQDWSTGTGPIAINGAISSVNADSWAVLAVGGDVDGGIFFTASTSLDVDSVYDIDGGPGFNELANQIGSLQSFTDAQPENVGADVSTSTSGAAAVPNAFTGQLIDSGGNVSVSTALGQSMGFFRTYSDFGIDGNDGVAGVTFAGTWTLAADGSSLAYSTTAIPLPAGVWLLGSALIGLVGISRRRQAAA